MKQCGGCDAEVDHHGRLLALGFLIVTALYNVFITVRAKNIRLLRSRLHRLRKAFITLMSTTARALP
jgi:hypothetical protein